MRIEVEGKNLHDCFCQLGVEPVRPVTDMACPAKPLDLGGAKIRKDGCVMLPQALRDVLRVKAGDVVCFAYYDGTYMIGTVSEECEDAEIE